MIEWGKCDLSDFEHGISWADFSIFDTAAFFSLMTRYRGYTELHQKKLLLTVGNCVLVRSKAC